MAAIKVRIAVNPIVGENVFHTVSTPGSCEHPTAANRAFHLRKYSFPSVGEIWYLR